MTYYDAAKIILEQSDVPMRLDAIWEKAVTLGYDKKQQKLQMEK